jgi:hypothetical protein
MKVEWDTSPDFKGDTGSAGSIVLPVVHERQRVTSSVDVTNEVQTIAGTVRVSNERQHVMSAIEGVDEVVTIETDCLPVVSEVQTINTYAADIDEVQTITTRGSNIDEIQTIRTSITPVDEVQQITITADDEDEVQQITISDDRRTQYVDLLADSAVMDIREEQVITLNVERETQTIKVHNNQQNGAFEDKNEVQIIKLEEPRLTQIIEITTGAPNTQGGMEIGYQGRAFCLNDWHNKNGNAIATDLQGPGNVPFNSPNPLIPLVGGTNNQISKVEWRFTEDGSSTPTTTQTGVPSSANGYATTIRKWELIITFDPVYVATPDLISVTMPTQNGADAYASSANCDVNHFLSIDLGESGTAMSVPVTSTLNNLWLKDNHGDFKIRLDSTSCDYCHVQSDVTSAVVQVDLTVVAGSNIENALNSMGNIGAGGVTVTRSDESAGEGYVWTVTFSGVAMQGDIPLLQITNIIWSVSIWIVLPFLYQALLELLRKMAQLGASSLPMMEWIHLVSHGMLRRELDHKSTQCSKRLKILLV